MTVRVGRTGAERDALIEQYLPLVRHVAARLTVKMPATLDRDDFHSVGMIGLIHAATTWDEQRGASFKTFAYTAIRGSMLDEIRRQDPVPRARRERLRAMDSATEELGAELGRPPTLEELAEHLAIPCQELDGDLLMLHTCRVLNLHDLEDGTDGIPAAGPIGDDECNPADLASSADDTRQLAAEIAALPDPDRNVIVLYFHEDLYLKEIGEILGVSESRISQILARAIERLRLACSNRN